MTPDQAWAASEDFFAAAQTERKRGSGWWANYFGRMSDGMADLACSLERNTEKAAPVRPAGREI